MTTPSSPSFSNALLGGVTCTSTTACIAVGSDSNAMSSFTLAERSP